LLCLQRREQRQEPQQFFPFLKRKNSLHLKFSNRPFLPHLVAVADQNVCPVASSLYVNNTFLPF
jgi:hypothetical protein